MKNMIAIKSKTHIVFLPLSAGLEYAKIIRKRHLELKYARINTVLQAFPSKVECGKVYPITHNVNYYCN